MSKYPDTKKKAVAIFEKARVSYHSLAAQKVAEILEVLPKE
jgi:hypothetical protein